MRGKIIHPYVDLDQLYYVLIRIVLYYVLIQAALSLQCVCVGTAVGWNSEDNASGVVKFGVAHYESTAKLKVKSPKRPLSLPSALTYLCWKRHWPTAR